MYIFDPVKRELAVISFLISMVIIIAHDAIHHHHNISGNIEITTSSHTDEHGHRHNDNHQNNKNHFPPHQHVITDSDFLTERNNISFNKVIKDFQQWGLAMSTLLCDVNYNTYFNGFIRVFKKPLSSYPFIISPDSTRGSPSIS